MALVALALGASADGEAAKQKLIIKKTGVTDLAIYYTGNIADPDPVLMGIETYVGKVKPGRSTARLVRMDDSFALRSADMKWRTSIIVSEHGESELPFKLTFHNIMGVDEKEPIELQHAPSEFLWVDPLNRVAHSAGQGHPFILKDKNKNNRVELKLYYVDKEEL